MKTIFSIILCIFLIFPNVINAEAVTTGAAEPCGVQLQSTGNADTYISNQDATICEQDIAQNTLYLMYSGIFDSAWGKELFFMFDINDNIRKLSFEIGVADIIKGVMNSYNYAIYMFIIGYIVVYGGKALFLTMSAGRGLNDKNSKPVVVMLNVLVLCFLIAPIDGYIMVVQYLILFIAMVAIALANYLYSSFLYAVEVKTSQFPVDDAQLRVQSAATSENLISGALCETRTTQQLLNYGFQPNRAFDEDNEGIMEDVGDKIMSCMSYYVQPSFNGEGNISGYQIHRPSLKYCFEQIESIKCGEKYCDDSAWYKRLFGSFLNEEYFDDVYGQAHSCATVNYNVPLYTEKFLGQKGMITSIGQAMKGEDDVDRTVNDLEDRYSATVKYPQITALVDGQIKSMLDVPLKERVVKEIQFQNYLDEQATILSRPIALEIGNDDRIDTRDGKFKADAINAKALGIVNAMLGLTNDEDDEFRLDGNEDKVYAIQILREDAKKAADLLEQAHCSTSFRDLITSQQTAISANEIVKDGDSDVVQHYLQKLGANGMNFECVKFTGTELGDDKSKEDYEFYYNAKNDSESVDAQLDISNGTHGKEFEIKKMTYEQKAQMVANFDKNYVIKLKEAYFYKLRLEAYSYIARKAVLIALQEALKRNNDNDLLISQRQNGFASGASMLIALSTLGGNASAYAETVKTTANIASNVDMSANGNFVNQDALTVVNLKEQEIDKEASDVPLLKQLKVTGFFNTLGNVKFNEKQPIMNKGNEEFEQSNMFKVYLQKLVLYPFDYIKQTSGFSQSGTIGDGLENCRKGTGRCIGDDSPIAGIIHTGHSLIEQGITLHMMKIGVNMAVSAIDPDDGKSKDLSGSLKRMFSKFNFLMAAGLAVLHALNVILNTLSPVFTLMLTLGIFLSYITPMMVWFYFATIFLGWLLHIFMKLFTAPIWMIFLAIFDTQGNTKMKLDQAWQHIGGVLLKPVFVVLSLVFAYSFTSVGLYFANNTMATFMSRLEGAAQGDIIVGIVGSVVLLSLYLAVVIYIIIYAFKAIHILPDYLLEMMNVKGSNDTNMVQSMQVQRILETYGAYKLSGMVEQGSNKITSSVQENSRRKAIIKLRDEELSIKTEFNNNYYDLMGKRIDIKKSGDEFSDKDSVDALLEAGKSIKEAYQPKSKTKIDDTNTEGKTDKKPKTDKGSEDKK